MRWPFIPIRTDSPVSTAQRLRGRRRRRRALWAPFAIVTLLLSGVLAQATTLVPPTFETLVEESELIARGSVTDISSRWVDRPEGRIIKTFVTFTIEKQMKGGATDQVRLEFLGGTVGQDTMRVSGMPEFEIGQTEILFVRGNGVQFCPLVRMGHGRYRVRTDPESRERYVARNDETPLEAVEDVQAPEAEHGHAPPKRSAAAAPLTPDDFERQIADEVVRQNR